jgi:hypothetical protein
MAVKHRPGCVHWLAWDISGACDCHSLPRQRSTPEPSQSVVSALPDTETDQ